MVNLSIKFYYNGEIRRFSMDFPPSGLPFAALLQKILNSYPNLDMSKTQLAWKDREGDLIVFSSDEELKEAVKNLNDDVFRVFTMENGHATRTDSKATETERKAGPGPDVHVGVVCDGCDGGLKGIRFKCLACPDFDLCAACEGKRLHDHHAMIRIASPQDQSWRQAFVMSQYPFPPHPRMWGRCPRRRCHPGERPERPERQERAERTERPEAEGEAGAGAQASGAAGWANAGGAQFLRDIGENIAAVLSNFGIDVDVDVEDHGRREKVSPPKTEAGATPKTETPTATAPMTAAQTTETPKTEAPQEAPMEAQREASPEGALGREPEAGTGRSDWMLVDKPEDHPFGAAAGTHFPNMYPSYPGIPIQQPMHPNPKIAASLAQMQAMGFTNEGGWLTQLLEAKGGDMNAVLDVLAPAKKL